MGEKRLHCISIQRTLKYLSLPQVLLLNSAIYHEIYLNLIDSRNIFDKPILLLQLATTGQCCEHVVRKPRKDNVMPLVESSSQRDAQYDDNLRCSLSFRSFHRGESIEKDLSIVWDLYHHI